jgi:energy-coupling factor transport system substrate-specific component
MKEVFSMWKHTRMVILVALSAAIYAAILIPFKGIPLIPGITEVRPANVFPVIFGLMFGPAGAWGAAIGNTIGDLVGGTIGWGSIAGFVGNFYLGFVAYKLWGALGLVSKDNMAQNTNTWKKLVAYIIITVVAASACAIIISWYLDLVGIVPFAFLGITIALNNSLAELILGPPLLLLLYPRVKQWGLIWTDIMEKEDVAKGFGKGIGAILMIIGSLGGLLVGVLISVGVYDQTILGFTGETGAVGVWLGVLPFLAMILIASFMLSGQEQFVEEEDEDED